MMAASSTPRRPLSFGVEIEGIADRPHADIKAAIDGAQLDGVVVRLARAKNRPKGPRDEWTITNDVTIQSAGGHPVEFASPTFSDDDTGGRQRWRHEIPAVLNAVKDGGITVETNRSTSLQVHVGAGRDEEYKPDELRLILMFITVYERKCQYSRDDATLTYWMQILAEIDKYHPPERSASWATDEQNIWVKSNRSGSIFTELGMKSFLSALADAEEESDLIQLMCPNIAGPMDMDMEDRNYKLNCVSLKKHKTLEFRQHEGTTNPDTICRWVDFVLYLVRAALSLTVEEIMQLDPDTTPLVPTFVPDICARRSS